MEIRKTHKPGAKCDWCGGDHSNSEAIYLTPESSPRAICDSCVDETDWILTSAVGRLMWQFCQKVKLETRAITPSL